MQLFLWVKHNKLPAIVIAILLFVLAAIAGKGSLIPLSWQTSPSMGIGYPADIPTVDLPRAEMMDLKSGAGGMPSILPKPDYPPQTGILNRLVVTESSLSLLVTDVTNVRKQILDHVTSLGGYMVSSTIDNPTESPTGVVIVRVPADTMEAVVSDIKGYGIKTVSEYVSGTDVTDQYIDVAKHIETLEKTKARFEAILTTAEEISDITNLNQQIIAVQSQIDALVGQQQRREGESTLARLSIYLSTDEIALPFAPSDRFRPDVIFKLAVRSLLSQLNHVGAFGIWIVVYSVIWIPVLFVLWLLYTFLLKNPLKKF